MVDMSKTIAPKSDQLNADDLLTGPRTIRITRVLGNESADQPVSIHFEGDNNKPYKPALSMRRAMVMIWGEDASAYIGRSMTLYTDPEVKFGGIKVGGIRISHMSHISQTQALMLTKTRGKKAEYRVQPLAQGASEQLLIDARAAADNGMEDYQKFFTELSGSDKRALTDSGEHDNLKKVAAQATEDAKPLSQKIAEQGEGDPSREQSQTTSERLADAKGEADQAPHWTADVNPQDGSNATAEWAEGALAQAEGKAYTDNPYENNMEAADDWAGGFNHAKGEAS